MNIYVIHAKGVSLFSKKLEQQRKILHAKNVVLSQLRKSFLSLAVHVQLIQGQQPGGHLQVSLEVAEGPPPAEPWFSLKS
jgi:hypothetical protein